MDYSAYDDYPAYKPPAPLLSDGEYDVLYDRFGAPRLRVLNDDVFRVLTWDGKHVGFILDSAVFNYQGQHIGWYDNGIMRDTNGLTVGFGVAPTDTPSPYLPFRQWQPNRGAVANIPYAPYVQRPYYKPYKQYGWADKDLVGMFHG